ncbi:MAG: N-acetylmuramoyl-L-alanine amidase [Clostridiales bacterium]|nr:N-acetylmuramoyl-L-alanine amidase [Clostridiales bacterium]
MENDKENKNLPNNENQGDEVVDMQAFLAGIKRVSADPSKTPAPKGAPKAAPKAAPASKQPPKAVPANPDKKTGASPAKSAPSARPASRAAREAMEKKRKRASIMLAVTAVLLVAVIGVGAFFAVNYFTGKNKPSDSVSSDAGSSTTVTRGTGTSEETTVPTSEESTEPTPTPTPAPSPFPEGGPNLEGYCVVIDAGHQAVANLDPEPMSSSMSGSKDKSSEGYSGVVSGINESEINLEVALLLRDYLTSLGCEVYMTRESNDVDISNKERAELAVSYSPDLYIRLYCNAANDSLQSGCEVIVPATGKYASNVTTWGENLGNTLASVTGSAFNGCKASSNYSGLNWADSVPSFMLRMGYLTNSDEESLLLDEEYQFKICQGIAQFVTTMPQN